MQSTTRGMRNGNERAVGRGPWTGTLGGRRSAGGVASSKPDPRFGPSALPGFFISLLAVTLLAGNIAAADNRPNIVVIMADDMGYGDVHALNPASRIPTPNLDRLSRQGMTFTDAHTPSAVCTPTRYGLLTGRYCWRSRLKRGVLNGYGKPLIEPDRPTFASFLKSHGYHSGIVGKWHLGLGFARQADGNSLDFSKPVTDGPNRRGFDFSFIIPASLDFPPYVYIRNRTVTDPQTVVQPAVRFPEFLRKGPRARDLVMAECLDHLKDQAIGYLKRRAADPDRRFVLYFPLCAPHKPVLPHPRFRGRTELGPYGDFIVQVDQTVGDVLKTLDDTGLADSTLVIYTSDNGSFMFRRDDPQAADHVSDRTIQAFRANHHRSNHVYRGTKADIWEAGHRVPFFVRWPGHVQPGSTSQATICLVDLFATFAELIDRPVPDGAARDSFSIAPLLSGKKRSTPRPPVIHHSAAGMFAVRHEAWKLVLGNGSGGREAPRGRPFRKPYTLFNIEKDPGETTNLIDKHPETAERLEAAFKQIHEETSP